MDPKPPQPIGLVVRLRQWIAEGRYAAGERLAEEAVAQALGVSRTPVRLAFRTLAQEGLLQLAGRRGYEVRSFSADDVRAAVEVRGVLEGLAARRLAEVGLSDAVRDELVQCLAEGELALAPSRLSDAGVARWSAVNARFHHAIVGVGPTRVIADAVARNNHLPFAAADSIAVRKDAMGPELHRLRLAQLQHRLVFDALVQRESARAEMLMREHAYIGLRYAALFGGEGATPPEAAVAATPAQPAARDKAPTAPRLRKVKPAGSTS